MEPAKAMMGKRRRRCLWIHPSPADVTRTDGVLVLPEWLLLPAFMATKTSDLLDHKKRSTSAAPCAITQANCLKQYVDFKVDMWDVAVTLNSVLKDEL